MNLKEGKNLKEPDVGAKFVNPWMHGQSTIAYMSGIERDFQTNNLKE